MAITYKGNVYEEVTDGSAEIGDLLHVTVLDGNVSDVWCFSTDDYRFVPDVDIKTRGDYCFLDDDLDVWARYRKITATKTTENKPTPTITIGTERYRVVNAAVTPPVYVGRTSGESVALTKNIKSATTYGYLNGASEAAKVANSYGLGEFRVYTESTVLTHAEAVDID